MAYATLRYRHWRSQSQNSSYPLNVDGNVKTSLNSSLLAEESQLSTGNLSSAIPSHNSPVEQVLR